MTYFECYADEALLRSLGRSSRDLSGGHSQGRSRVCAKLSRASGAFGLVDEDPGSARDPYLTYLYSLLPTHEDSNMILFEDKKANNRLLVLRPTLEHVVVKIADDCKLDLGSEKYRLSMKARRLHDILSPKHNSRERNRLIDFLNDAKGSKVMKAISSLIP